MPDTTARCRQCGATLPEGVAECPECEQPTRELPVLPSTIGGYKVLHALGSGGMGTVFLAEDPTLARRVAVKVVSGKSLQDESGRTRFLREARAMATVEHPNVVHVYSFGESEGRPYIVMEYVEGETLASRIRRVGPLPVAEAVDLVRQAVLALEAAWEKGIVHRDVKPPNILIDKKGRVRVADFGLAKPSPAPGDPSVTQDGSFLGTPNYVSPEQARGEWVDFRSDVYSLGIVLYELLAGVPPFRGTTPVAVMAQHLQTPLPALREKRSDVPAGLVRLVEQMTEKEPGRRPQSYAELREALGRVADTAPSWTSGSPYRGLAAFDFEHAEIFFGRSLAIREVVSALRTQAALEKAFVLVLGMSGSGKSSLLRAGVVPLLTQAEVAEATQLWRRAMLRPGDASGDLFDALASALLRPEALPELGADGTTGPELGRLLRDHAPGAGALVKGGLSQAAAELRRRQGLAAQPEARIVLVLDQMEELFTLESVTAAERSGFVALLSALARSGRVYVLATLRSDFYSRCEELPELMALKEGAGQYHLGAPTPAEIGQMIRQPARAAGLHFEEDPDSQVGLDEILRDAAAGQAGNLPLLEFALEELYQRRTPEGLLTYAAYEGIGGVEGALGHRAEAVFASLSDGAQSALAEVFHALVRVASVEEKAFNRKYAPLDSFTSAGSRALVDAFIVARLFVADRGDDGRAIVSIGHEALLRSWSRLREWLEENRELLRVRGRVSLAASLWHEKGRPGDLLLAEGKALEEALPLLRTPSVELTEGERALVELSAARERGRQRARQIMNVNTAVLLVGGAAITSFYLAKVVPTLAALNEKWGQALALPVRIQIHAANWTVRLSPALLGLGVVCFIFRKRIPIPEFVRSGVALAVVTGLATLLSLFALLMALVQLVPILKSLLEVQPGG